MTITNHTDVELMILVYALLSSLNTVNDTQRASDCRLLHYWSSTIWDWSSSCSFIRVSISPILSCYYTRCNIIGGHYSTRITEIIAHVRKEIRMVLQSITAPISTDITGTPPLCPSTPPHHLISASPQPPSPSVELPIREVSLGLSPERKRSLRHAVVGVVVALLHSIVVDGEVPLAADLPYGLDGSCPSGVGGVASILQPIGRVIGQDEVANQLRHLLRLRELPAASLRVRGVVLRAVGVRRLHAQLEELLAGEDVRDVHGVGDHLAVAVGPPILEERAPEVESVGVHVVPGVGEGPSVGEECVVEGGVCDDL